MTVRAATLEDVPMLAERYAASVKTLGPLRYSALQVEVWASFADEREPFHRFILDAHTIVAEDDSVIAGFCGIDARDHVASLYVHGDRGRQGIGSRLLKEALDLAGAEGIVAFHAEASSFSLPVFERFRFVACGIEKAVRRGIEFTRYIVRKGG